MAVFGALESRLDEEDPGGLGFRTGCERHWNAFKSIVCSLEWVKLQQL